MFLSFDLYLLFFVILRRAKEPFELLVKYKILKKKKKRKKGLWHVCGTHKGVDGTCNSVLWSNTALKGGIESVSKSSMLWCDMYGRQNFVWALINFFLLLFFFLFSLLEYWCVISFIFYIQFSLYFFYYYTYCFFYLI